MTHYVVVVCDELDPMEQNFYFDDFKSAFDFYNRYFPERTKRMSCVYF